MRVCFLCSEYPPGPHGGIGTMTRVLGRALAAAGHEVRVVGVYGPGYPAPDYEEDGGVRVWRLREPRRPLGWCAARLRLQRMVAAWARGGAVDVVEAPDYQGWVAGWPGLAVPVTVRLHGSASYFAAETGQRVGRQTYWLERAALLRADRWCSVSRYTAERTARLFRLPGGPATILHNPVELPAGEVWAPRGRAQVVFTGTLTAKKGVASLCRAWPRVRARRPDAELHIFGKDGAAPAGGSMRAWLERELGATAAQGVTFHGHVPRERLFAALAGARAAVFPSYAEAFSLAPLEAMVRGCPTIYSSRGFGRELIVDGRDGLLVDPDDAGAIAAAVLRVLDDDGLAAALGAAGAGRVRAEFSVEAQLPRNLSYYEGLVAAHAARARKGEGHGRTAGP